MAFGFEGRILDEQAAIPAVTDSAESIARFIDTVIGANRSNSRARMLASRVPAERSGIAQQMDNEEAFNTHQGGGNHLRWRSTSGIEG